MEELEKAVGHGTTERGGDYNILVLFRGFEGFISFFISTAFVSTALSVLNSNSSQHFQLYMLWRLLHTRHGGFQHVL